MTDSNKQFKISLIFKLLVSLISGVVVAFYFPINMKVEFVLPGFLLLFVLSSPFVSRFPSVRNVFGIATSVIFFVLGLYLVSINVADRNTNYFIHGQDEKEHVFQVEILDEPTEKERSIKCFASIRAVDNQTKMGKVLLYFEKTPRSMEIAYGDILLFKSRFNPVVPNGNPHEFDYSRYLRIHNVRHQAYVNESGWVYLGNVGNGILTGINSARSFLDKLLADSGLDEQNLMVARALILGEKDYLDRDTLRTFSSAGAMHVLAVSGLHVGIIMLIASFLFRPVKQFSGGKWVFIILVMAVLWGYALITGMSSSVMRASVMFSFVVVGKELERDTSIYQSIMVSAFLLILIEPLVIFQVGFQLSYLAVIGIIFLQPKIYNLFYTRFYLLDKVWQITSVSVAAQIATFPLGLYYFHQFPNLFLLSNLIVIPLAFAILITGIAYFILFWIPVLSDFIFLVLKTLVSILNIGVAWVESIPYSIYWGGINLVV